MSERIVVGFRMNGEEVSRLGARYLERARSLTARAEAAGATLAAWSATTMAFAFDVDSLDEALEVIAEATTAGEAPRWGAGVALGALDPLADKGVGRADLAWGDALVVAGMLASAARAGEALVDASFPRLDEVFATGRRIARDGDRAVRGVRFDPRRPWKRDAGPVTAHLVGAPFVGDVDPAALVDAPGVVHVVRADPGHGGSRLLAEIAAAARGPSLHVAPVGASVEPLGALRRAVTRALARRGAPIEDRDLAPIVTAFVAGGGASIEQAAAIALALLTPVDGAPGVLAIDDAGEVDAESLEACAQVVAWAGAPIHVVARIDATDSLPGALASLPAGREIELGPLDVEHGVALAASCVDGGMERRAARRIARRACYAPLGIVEAAGLGIVRGDLVVDDGRVGLRQRASFAGKPAPISHWVAKRAKRTKPDERGVLAAVALLGGDARVAVVKAALARVEPGIAVEEEVAKLVERRWLVAPQPGWVALPSRTHRDTIAELLDEAPRRVLHHAIAEVLEQTEGELAWAEAAHHAVKAGEGERGARLSLRAARAAAKVGMPKSANRLLTLARLADPKCEPLTRQQLLTSLPPNAPAIAPPAAVRAPLMPPAPTTSRIVDDSPTEQRAIVGAGDAPGILADARELRDSDGPTLIRPSDAERPTEPQAAPAIDAPSRPNATMIGVAPAPPIVRAPPPRPGGPALASKPPPPLPSAASPAAAGARPPVPVVPLAPPSRAAPAPPPRPASVASATIPEPPRPRPPPLPPRASNPAMAAVRPPAPPVPRPAPSAASAATPANPANAANPASSPVEEPASVGSRMIDLAKLALLEGDAAAVDRWTEGLRAAGDHDRVASRIDALARLSRGQTDEALRALRAAHDEAAAIPALRAQSSLAFALALAASHREEDALLAALEALARAREGNDARGAEASLAFLAKLYARLARADDAAKLKAAAIRR